MRVIVNGNAGIYPNNAFLPSLKIQYTRDTMNEFCSNNFTTL